MSGHCYTRTLAYVNAYSVYSIRDVFEGFHLIQ